MSPTPDYIINQYYADFIARFPPEVRIADPSSTKKNIRAVVDSARVVSDKRVKIGELLVYAFPTLTVTLTKHMVHDRKAIDFTFGVHESSCKDTTCNENCTSHIFYKELNKSFS